MDERFCALPNESFIISLKSCSAVASNGRLFHELARWRKRNQNQNQLAAARVKWAPDLSSGPL